jgi:hypothetical protein
VARRHRLGTSPGATRRTRLTFASRIPIIPHSLGAKKEYKRTVESWRKAWNGTTPVEPFQDTEWVEKRRDFLAERSDPSTVSDDVAAHEYRAIQAQWMIDHVEDLEEAGAISRERAVQIRRFRPSK